MEELLSSICFPTHRPLTKEEGDQPDNSRVEAKQEAAAVWHIIGLSHQKVNTWPMARQTPVNLSVICPFDYLR